MRPNPEWQFNYAGECECSLNKEASVISGVTMKFNSAERRKTHMWSSLNQNSRHFYDEPILISAINMLRDKPPGTFVVRDSNSFPGAFGLALKVAQPPPGVQPGINFKD